MLHGEQASTAAALGSSASGIASAITTLLSSILLSGMLTVIVGRAVFGAGITIGEAWQRVRGRLLALLGYTLLWLLGVVLLVGVVVFVVVLVPIVSGAAAVILGIPLGLRIDRTAGLPVDGAQLRAAADRVGTTRRVRRRSRGRSSWSRATSGGCSASGCWSRSSPASSRARCRYRSASPARSLLLGSESTTTTLIALALIAIGGAIGQIITAPFSAGVVVLLYTDRRIRAEAFDLVLQTGAAIPPRMRRRTRPTTCG